MPKRQLHTTPRTKSQLRWATEQPPSGAPAIEPLAVTVKETQRLLSCCHVTVYNLIGAKRLVARKLGRRTLITTESIQALLTGLPPAKIAPPKRALQQQLDAGELD